MKKISFLMVSLIVAPFAQSASQAEIDAAARAQSIITGQEQQRIQMQKQQLEAPVVPSGMDLGNLLTPISGLPTANQKCIELERLNVIGSELLDAWEVEVLEAPFLGKCITSDLAAAVLASTTDFHLKRGFITTRAYLPNQDLRDGVIDVYIGQGKVDKAEVLSEKTMFLGTAYQIDEDLGLNIRDLEQAVDQLNAVPGNSVTMAIAPGLQPQSSNIIFENKGAPAIKGRISLDNSGGESTGKNGATLSVQTGNLLGLNDVWYLNARESLGDPEKSSNSSNLDVRVPHGYNTYGAGYAKGGFSTILTFPLTGTELTNEGANESFYVSASRVIARDQNSKHTVNLKLKRDSVESYLADIRIDVGSRTLTSLIFSTESALRFDKGILIFTPQISIGLTEVNNLPVGVNTPVENPQSEYLVYKTNIDWLHPIQFNNHSLRWKSKLAAQYSDVPLYGSQQIIVGGAGSVRGSHFVSIVGDSGYYWQNSLNLTKEYDLGGVAADVEYMVGYDFGHVWSQRPDVYEGSMKAMIAGATLTTASWNLAMTHSIPVAVDVLDKGDAFTTLSVGYNF
mgnify:CR=1 FL=1